MRSDRVFSLGHRSVGDSFLGDDVEPVSSVFRAVDPLPALRDRIFVMQETGAVRPLGSSCIRRLAVITLGSKDQDRVIRRRFHGNVKALEPLHLAK